MAVDGYSVQLITSLLGGTSTEVASPGSAETGDVSEAFIGNPLKIAAGASDVNIKLGTLTSLQWLAVFGGEGISFKIANGGTDIGANPFGFVSDVDDELTVSEIWVSNSSSVERSISVLAAE